jgi:hypothetical protein
MMMVAEKQKEAGLSHEVCVSVSTGQPRLPFEEMSSTSAFTTHGIHMSYMDEKYIRKIVMMWS